MKNDDDRFSQILNNPDPFVSLVLQGHLLIEEQLNRILEKHLPHSEFIKDFNISSFRKIQIAKSLVYHEQDKKDWVLIEKINSLRNKVAHNLESKKIKEAVLSIAKELGDSHFSQKLKDTKEFDYETTWLACAFVYNKLEKL